MTNLGASTALSVNTWTKGPDRCSSRTLLEFSRREVIGLLGTTAVFGLAPVPSFAESPSPIDVHEGFDLIRREMTEGGVYKLGQMVETEDWEAILGFTKLYDLSFRKVDLYRVSEALTDKAAHDKVK